MKAHFRRGLQATVIGDSEASDEACRAAQAIGALLARLGVTVVTGGRGAVMEAASRGAVEAGGTTVGILPSASMADANPWCRIAIPTGLGHARNVLTVLSGDFVIALGGAAGTLSELCFAWIHGKPIITLRGYAGWVDKIAATPLDHRESSRIIQCGNLEELEKAVREMISRD